MAERNRHRFSETAVITADGISLMTYAWETDIPGASLLLLHGLGEHARRWEPHIVHRLLPLGLDVYAYDLRGHGRSGGEPWTIARFGAHLADLALVTGELARADKIGGNSYLMGHSLGGLIAASHLAENRDSGFAGAIFSSGAFRVGSALHPWAHGPVRLVAALFPRLGLAGIPPKELSSLSEAVAAYENDPLVYHGKLDAQTTVAINDQQAWLRAHAAAIELPLLLLYGTDDRVIDPEGSRMLFEAVSSDRKSLVPIPDSRHETFNDVGADRFFAEIEAMVTGEAQNRAAPSGW